MLVTLVIWLYILFLSYLYGWWGIRMAWRATRSDSLEPGCFSQVSITGFCLMGILAGCATLFMRLGWIANLGLLTGAGVILWTYRRDISESLRRSLAGLRKTNPLILILFIALSLIALVRASDFPLNYDTGLYHAQAIRWIESYPAIPGLANLHFRLGFNSSWLLTSALFSFSFIGSGSYHVVNGLFYLLVITYGLTKVNRLMTGEVSLTNLIGLFVVFFSRYLFALELSSPGNDMPAALLVWLVFLLSLEKIERAESDQFNALSLLILLLSAWAVTIKLSVLPILLLPVYFTIHEYRSSWRNSRVMIASIFLLVMLPWAVRSVIQSGYLIFPVAQTGLSFLDWCVPPGDVQVAEQAILSWARLPGVDPAIVLQMPYSEWVPAWFNALQALDRRLVYGLVMSLVILATYWIFTLLAGRDNHLHLQKYLVLYVTAVIGVAYWFIQAPAFRFGYGFLVILLCVSISPALWVILDDSPLYRRLIISVFLLGMLLYQGVGIYHLRAVPEFQNQAVYPATYPMVQVDQEKLGNFTVFAPTSGDQCWYTELPCTPLNNPWVNLRGQSISDGFYDKRTTEKLPDRN